MNSCFSICAEDIEINIDIKVSVCVCTCIESLTLSMGRALE